MSSRTCFGISKVANLFKSLDSESSSDDKIGISFIMTQPLSRSGWEEIPPLSRGFQYGGLNFTREELDSFRKDFGVTTLLSLGIQYWK